MANRIFLRVGTWYKALEKYLSTDLEITDVVDDPDAEFPEVIGEGGGGGLPTQAGHSGEFLKTDGTNASWDTPAGGALNYLVYTALLYQTGTNAPVATVLENTLGGTVVWSYSAAGQYLATLNTVFTANKTAILLGFGTVGVLAYWIDIDTIEVDTVDDTFTSANGRLNGDTIEIRVYPV